MMTRKQHVDYWLHGASESMKDMRSAIIRKIPWKLNGEYDILFSKSTCRNARPFGLCTV